jgi:hypothetical protein
MWRVLVGLLAGLGFVGEARGQAPLPAAPAPEVVVVPLPAAPFPDSVPEGVGFYRPSAYDVWQDYAPDRGGRWRPRVVYSPAGIYYHYSGMPYPFASVHPRYFMTYVTD